MTQAVNIILARVAGSGVTEPEITTQGSNNIVVSVPGVDADQIVKLVGQTAELRFRQVLAVDVAAPQPTPTPTPKARPRRRPSRRRRPSPRRRPRAAATATPPTWPRRRPPRPHAEALPRETPAGEATDSEVTILTQPPADAAAKLAAFTCAEQRPADGRVQDIAARL